MRKKALGTVLLVILSIGMLSGCSDDKFDGTGIVSMAKQSSEEEKKTEALTEDDSDLFITDKTERITQVGSDVNGYIDLSEGEWVKFVEAGGGIKGEQVVAADQATTVTNSAIITMVTYDMDRDLDELTQESMAYCDSTGAKDLEGARGTIGGYDCNKIYCYYPDCNRYLFVWYFRADDDYIHYISAEFSPDDKYVMDVIESYHKNNEKQY